MSDFRRAVSWIFHSEELDKVQERFNMTDQQMEDALAVADMFDKISHEIEIKNEDFNLYNEVQNWSKKDPFE